jgi:hypothetical protein
LGVSAKGGKLGGFEGFGGVTIGRIVDGYGVSATTGTVGGRGILVVSCVGDGY